MRSSDSMACFPGCSDVRNRTTMVCLCLSMILPALGSAQQTKLAIPHTYQLYKTSNSEILAHDGALDVRFHDFDADGDEDLVTFGITGSSLEDDVKFWKNTLVQGGHSPNLFDPFDFADLLVPGLLVGGSPNPAYFQGIYDMQFVDVEGDGDDDWIALRLQATDLLFTRDSGKFQVPTDLYSPQTSDYCGLGVRYSTGLAVADIDGDTDPDFVACFRDSKPRLYLNNSGQFSQAQVFPAPTGETQPTWPVPGAGFRDVHLSDLDHDGDLDCVLARMQHNQTCTHPSVISVVVYQNMGMGNGPFQFWYKLKPGLDCFDDEDTLDNSFTDGVQHGSPSLSIEVDDANDDGWDDVFQPVISSEMSQLTAGCTPSGCSPYDKRARLYLNNQDGFLGTKDGSGTPLFRPSLWIGSCSENDIASWAYPEDIDLDGDADVVVAHHAGSGIPDRIWRNAGNDASGKPIYVLRQSIGSILAPDNDDTRYVRFEDLDQDGDEDYVETNFATGAFSRIFYNRIFNP